MLLLGVDVETTGLDTANDRIIELGAVLWSVEEKKPLVLYSDLIFVGDREVPAVIESLTGISDGHVKKYGMPLQYVLGRFNYLAQQADFIVAHNGTNFDKPILEAEYARACFPFPKAPWIDTSVDVPYPEKTGTRKLTYLAAEHGFLNPFAHRAIFDVLTMTAVLSRYDAEEVARISKEPSVTLTAMTRPPWVDGGKSNDAAKAKGYRWNGADKKWQKTVKRSQVSKEVTVAEFETLEEVSAKK